MKTNLCMLWNTNTAQREMFPGSHLTSTQCCWTGQKNSRNEKWSHVIKMVKEVKSGAPAGIRFVRSFVARWLVAFNSSRLKEFDIFTSSSQNLLESTSSVRLVLKLFYLRCPGPVSPDFVPWDGSFCCKLVESLKNCGAELGSSPVDFYLWHVCFFVDGGSSDEVRIWF